MNAELEALLRSFDALLEARSGADAERLKALHESRLEDALAKRPGLTREQLVELVDFAYRRWIKAQKKFPTVPPKA
jgi:hypothetical protein